MKCNIDNNGIRMRRIGGRICCVLGLGMAVLAVIGAFKVALFCTGLGFLAAGLFQLYQARKGWCAFRAMGVKTPF